MDIERKDIIVVDGSFHGRTLVGLMSGSNIKHREGFLPHPNFKCGFVRVPFGIIEELEKNINSKTAAIFFEPIQGEGGLRVAKNSYLQQVRDLCNKNKIIMALDEVQCGIGRTGKMFSYQWSRIKPDIVGVEKGLGNGFHIGAVLCLSIINI